MRPVGWALILLGALCPVAHAGPRQAVDPARSHIRIHVFRAGLFSLFAHNHEIEAPIATGWVDWGTPPALELRFATAALRVLDSGVSASTRSEIQHTMLSPAVLDAAHFPEIQFRSAHIEPLAPDRWQVTGTLSLHGQTRNLVVEVRQQGEAFTGTLRLRQSDFGIPPLRLAGGTVRVRDEVEIRFVVHLQGNAPLGTLPVSGIGNGRNPR